MDLPGLSGKNLYLFILLVLPGFIAQSVYDLFVPHGERDASSNLFLGIAYGTLNLRATWTTADKRWSFSAGGRNITDQKYLTQVLEAGAMFGQIYGEPANYYVEVNYRYGARRER